MTYRFSGFRDGHCHPLFAARESAGPILNECHSAEAVLEAIKGYLEANPNAIWVDAGSVDRSLALNGKLDAVALDLVSPNVPVVVHAADHHAIWVNSAALRVAGLEFAAPEIPNAHIDVDMNGKPTGMLHEWDAMNLIYAWQPKPTLDADLEALTRAQTLLLSKGVVAVQEAWIDPGMPEVYIAAVERGLLEIRVNLAPRIAPQTWRQDLDFAITTRKSVLNAESNLLTCNTVKIFIDGVLSSRTALLSAPYACVHGVDQQTEAEFGTQIWQIEQLQEMAVTADSAGFQLHFHAIGDAAVSLALNTIRHVVAVNGGTHLRPVIAHAELVAQADLSGLAELGVVICQQPVWAQNDAAFEEARLAVGVERSQQMYPIKSLLEAGVMVSFGSDWPVSSPDPLPGVYMAEHRGTPESQAKVGVHEAISRKSALEAYSLGTAIQLSQDRFLTEDWVDFDTDLESCSAEELLAAKVLRACVAGRIRNFNYHLV